MVELYRIDKMYFIREAIVNDLEQIYAIWYDFNIQPYPQRFSNDDLDRYKLHIKQRLELQNKTFKFWVISSNEGRIVGWQSILPSENNPIYYYTEAESSTYISKEYMDSGLGLYLLQYVIEKLKYTQLTCIYGKVYKWNLKIQKLIEHLGFQLIGEVPNKDVLFYVYNF